MPNDIHPAQELAIESWKCMAEKAERDQYVQDDEERRTWDALFR